MKLFENIVYAKKAGADGAGDLFLPENFSENTCLALCIHGGAWNSMSRERMRETATFLCRDLGLAVYNINYRLAGEGWHEYTLDLSSNPLWKGAISELWFDPPQLQFTVIDIRWMRMDV